MSVFEHVTTYVRRSAMRRQTRTGLNSCLQPGMQQFLSIRLGMSEGERATVLRADPKMTAIILNAFSRQGADLAETVTASLHVMEALRFAETATLSPIEQQYAARASELTSIANAYEARDQNGNLLSLPALEALVDRLRNTVSNIQRRANSFLWRAIGLMVVGFILL